MVLEKKIFKCFSHYKPMADNDAPGAWPIFTPGSRLAGIIKELTLLHTKYKNSGPHGLREEDFLRLFLL